MSDGSDGDGQNAPQQWDLMQWLTACQDAVANLNTNLEAVTVCLKNVSVNLTTLIGLMDGRPAMPRLSDSAESGGQPPVQDS